MKKLLFLVLAGALLFTACGGEKTAAEYVKDTATAVCDTQFDCYPAEATATYGTKAQCITQQSDTWNCDNINYSNADTCVECYQNVYSCSDVASNTDPCQNTPECLYSCNG